MVQCPIKDCGKEFGNNAGLSSHMRSTHQASIPTDMLNKPEQREQRELRLRYGIQRPVAKAESTIAAHKSGDQPVSLEERYKKLWAKGNFTCLECRDDGKRVSFPNPLTLGRHRKFAHGVQGRNFKKNRAAVARHKEILAGQGQSLLDEPGAYSCPHCPRVFTTLRGLTVHTATTHRDQSAPASIVHLPAQELPDGKPPQQSNRNAAPNNAELAEALAIAHVTGQFKSLILAASHEYDVPPRQFAKRCILTLSKQY